MPIGINEGTQTFITSTASGTELIPHQVVDGGTLQNLASGTLNALASGTILTFGIRHPDEFATLVSSGTSTLGTIRAGVTGSAIYVTHLMVSVGSASNVVIGNGGTANPIWGTAFFNANGGAIDTPINPPLRTSNGSALVYQQSANGPMTIQAGGYID